MQGLFLLDKRCGIINLRCEQDECKKDFDEDALIDMMFLRDEKMFCFCRKVCYNSRR